jgi:hypothetical protein
MQPGFLCRAAAAVVLSTAAARSTANAQKWSGIAAVDSASVARLASARASEALRTGDVAAARREYARAAHAWPTQPAYVWVSAVFAARQRDTSAVLAYLRAFADLGLGRDLAADSSLAAVAQSGIFADVRSRLAGYARPLVRSRVTLTFGDSSFWPEGVDADAATRHFYVASIRHRTIADVAPDGSARELWPRDRRDMGAIFSVRVDPRRRTLWATTSGVRQTAGYVPADSAVAALLEIRPSDGAILRRLNVPPVAGGHVLGDLAIGPGGDVFMTDSNQPVLYWLRPGLDTLESITSPLFHSLQGLAPSPDGRTLYLTDYSHGLLRVDLRSRVVTRVADAPHSTSLGCDGIAWYRGSIVAVQNGVAPARIVQMVLNSAGDRIARFNVVDRNFALADEPTIGTILGDDFIYVANGQWGKFDDDGHRLAGTVLSRPILLRVPLGRERAPRD